MTISLSKLKLEKMSVSSGKITIIVAIIGLVGAVAAASISNIEKIEQYFISDEPHIELKNRLNNTLWKYQWRNEEFNMQFGSDGEIHLLSGWKDSKWEAVNNNTVMVITGNGQSMELIFDEGFKKFKTVDWGGSNASGYLITGS